MIGSLFGRSAIVGSLAPSIAASALKPMVPSEAAIEPSTLDAAHKRQTNVQWPKRMG